MGRFRKALATIEASGHVLMGRVGALPAAARCDGARPARALLALLFMKQPVSAKQGAGLQIEGDAAALQHLIDPLEPVPQALTWSCPRTNTPRRRLHHRA